MATQHVIDKAEIRQRINTLVEAIRAMDLESVMSSFTPDVVSFDIEPPLQHIGIGAKRQNWTRAFSMYQPPLGYEVRDLTITAGEGVAFAHSLNRISGTLKNGQRNDVWVRWTGCLKKIDGRWLIAHDQVSVPLDLPGGKGLLDLEP